MRQSRRKRVWREERVCVVGREGECGRKRVIVKRRERERVESREFMRKEERECRRKREREWG